MKLQEKTILITGGTSGLGYAIAKKALEKEAIVYITGRNKDKLEKALSELQSEKLHTLHIDVRDYEALENAIKQIGEIDILINNAGVWLEGTLETNSKEQIDTTIDTNVKGVIYTTRAVLPQMLDRNEGFIVNISSSSGLKGRGNQSVYVASKYAVTGFTKSLQIDLEGTNVKVAGFYPGGINTNLFAQAGFPKPIDDWMSADDVAEIIIFMLERNNTMLLHHVELSKRGSKYSFSS